MIKSNGINTFRVRLIFLNNSIMYTYVGINICGRIFTPHFGALWDECSDVDSRRHQSRGPQQAASTRLKSGVVKPFDLNSSFS